MFLSCGTVIFHSMVGIRHDVESVQRIIVRGTQGMHLSRHTRIDKTTDRKNLHMEAGVYSTRYNQLTTTERGTARVDSNNKNTHLRDSGEVVAVDGDHFPSVRNVARGGVLGHGELGHLVEGYVVGVVHDDKVVQLLVRGEGSRLGAHTLLHHPKTCILKRSQEARVRLVKEIKTV